MGNNIRALANQITDIFSPNDKYKKSMCFDFTNIKKL